MSMKMKRENSEIASGIFMKKEFKEEKGKEYYIYRVEIQRLKQVQLLANFEGSAGIEIVEDSNYLKEGLTTNSILQPFEKKVIAKVELGPNCKIVTHFGVNLKDITKEQQQGFMAPKLEEVRQAIEQFDLDINTQQSSPKEIIALLQSRHFVDAEFPPQEISICNEESGVGALKDNVVQFKRLGDLFSKQAEIHVCKEELNRGGEYIQLGCVGNVQLYSALCNINEKTGLVSRLVEKQQYNSQGVYYAKLFWEGQQHTVVVDDYLPCLPLGDPLFCSSIDKDGQVESWPMIVEKAICKLLRSYYNSRLLSTKDVLYMVTGCPTYSSPLSEYKSSEEVFSLLESNVKQQYIVTLQMESEEEEEGQQSNQDRNTLGFHEGYAYMVLKTYRVAKFLVVQLRNHNKLISFKSDIVMQLIEKQELRQVLEYEESNKDYTIYLTIEECLQFFSRATVCMVQNWEDTKVRGVFTNTAAPSAMVQSRMYYNIHVQNDQKMVICLFQEDEVSQQTSLQRPNTEIGLVILRKNKDNTVQLYHYQDYQHSANSHHVIDFLQGDYILLPRTLGLSLAKSSFNQLALKTATPILPQVDFRNVLDPAVKSFLGDLFAQLDFTMKGYLDKDDLLALGSLLGIDIDRAILKKHLKNNKFIRQKAFGQLFQEVVGEYSMDQNHFKDKVIKSSLGYNEYLYNQSQRSFVLQVFSPKPLEMIVRDALLTDIDTRTTLMVISRIGKEFEVPRGIKAYYTNHEQVHGYAYVVLNEQTVPILVSLDSTDSINMFCSSETPLVKKVLAPGALEFMQYVQAVPNAVHFTRRVIVSWTKAQTT